MSVEAIAAVFEHSKAKARGHGLLVLLALADCANPKDGNVAYPSLTKLAEKVRLQKSRVCKTLNALEATGELTRLKSTGGRNRRSRYIITCVNSVTGETVFPLNSVTGDMKTVSPVRHAKNRKGNRKEEGVPSSTPILPSTTTGDHHGGNGGGTGHHGFHAHGFVELYASSAPNLPQPRQVTNGRMRKIGQRLKTQPSREFWEDVFSKANQTPFLKGENDRGWKATLDWFVANDENAVKVLEGKYDPARGGGRKAEPDPWAKYNDE